ncbi:MAG: class I adenylate cyclase [Desulfovibrionaceae bacterium]|nr:class I adenylate cyclase [Desulfovibrionaceae bacterium]
MTDNNPSLRDLADALGAALLDPFQRTGQETLGLVEAVPRALSGGLPAQGPERLAAGEVACGLLSLAEQQRVSADIAAALRGLTLLGRFGCVMACRFVSGGHVSIQQLDQVGAALTLSAKLLIINELLGHGALTDKHLAAWAKGLLDEIAGCDPKQAFEVLIDLGATGETVSFPVKEALLRSPFRDWLFKRLDDPVQTGPLVKEALAVRALNDEIVYEAFAQRAAAEPEPGPTVIDILSRSGRSGAEALLKITQNLLRRPDSEAIPDCVDALARTNWPKTGQVMALLFKNNPEIKGLLAARACLLNEESFGQFTASLKGRDRDLVYGLAFEALAEIEPAFALDCLERPGPGDPAREKIKALLKARLEDAPETAGGPRAAAGPEEVKKGLLSRLVGDKRPEMSEVLAKTSRPKGLDLAGSHLEGQSLEKGDWRDLRLVQSSFRNCTFERVKFSSSDLSGCDFQSCSFSGCEFVGLRLRDAVLKKCQIKDCSFERCDLGGARIEGCVVADSSMNRCLAPEALFADLAASRLKIAYSCLAGCRFQAAKMRSSRFLGADLCCSVFCRSNLQGVEFRDTVLDHSRLTESAFWSCVMDGCGLAECAAQDLVCPGPELLAAQREHAFRTVRAMAGQGDPGPARTPDPVLREALDLWIVKFQAADRERVMLANNQRRLDWALRKMSPGQAEFFKLLPYLLHSDLFEAQKGLEKTPRCSVHGYCPDCATLELADRRFPGAKPSRKDKDAVRIEALYTMGSTGTVAQTPLSDIDCWVCCDAAGLGPEQAAGLKEKLDALSAWAGESFGLEVHFFPMTLDQIRENDFGFSDKESSGSAQAILLKDEFYRTAMLVAGKKPAWWISPPGAGAGAYARCLRAAAGLPRPGLEDFADLGPLMDIPLGEFFGASLWQMAKALKEPYKSVMKLGLLEVYSGPAKERGLMLCDQIKRNLMEGRRRAQDIDPYTVLFRRLKEYYTWAKDTDAVDLIKASFSLKTHPEAFDFSLGAASRFEEKSFLAYFLGPDKTSPAALKGMGAKISFERSMHLGAAMNRYMINTYNKIQFRLSSETGRTKPSIGPQDMTRLGRKILAIFAPKPDKIQRAPFLALKNGGVSELLFLAEKSPGKETHWLAKAKDKAVKGARHMEVVRRDSDPARLLAWLVVNGLFSPEVLVQGERSLAPLAVADVQALLSGLLEFFPPAQDEFDDLDQGLEPERVTRAFLALNLTAPRSTAAIVQVSVLYATNWGEMFCRTVDNPGPKLEKRPSAFLQEVLAQPQPEPPQIKIFTPKGAKCRRIPAV